MADHQRQGPHANPPYGGTQAYGYDPAQYAAYYGQQGYDPNSYYAYYGGYQQAGGAPAGAPPGQPPPPADSGAQAPPPPPANGGNAAAVAASGAEIEAEQVAPPLPPEPSGQPPPPGPPGAAQQQGYYAQQQQPGYGGYPAAGQQYDYSQYYAQQQYNQYYQQPGYGYGQAGAYQQPYGSYGQGAPPPQPPPTLPPPPGGPHASPVQQQPQQPSTVSPVAPEDEPAWKKAALRVAASAAAQLAQRSKQGQAQYNAVPPPGERQQQRGPGRPGAAGFGGFAIKAQAPKPRQQAHNPLVDAFNAAAASITTAGPAGAPGRTAVTPAYLRVGDAGAAGAAGPSQAGAAQQPAGAQGAGGGGGAAAGASGAQAWPPSLKAWVERVFKLTDAKQRPKLQLVLKTVIQDATNKGELWTRDWDTMPLPDLSQPAEDAAAILSEVAAVSGPAAGAPAGGAGRSWASIAGGGIQRTSRWQQQQQWGGGGGENGSAAAAAWGGTGGGRRGGGRELSISPPRGGSKRGRGEDGDGEQQWGRGKQGRARGRQGSAADRRRADQADRHGAARRNKRRAYSSDSSGYSSDASAEGAATEHLSAAERRRRARRAGRFGDGLAHAGPGGRPVGGSTAEERRQRLQALLEEGDAEDIDWDSLAIKGTSQAIEKSYFRLTSAPDPSTVRPEPVLARALQRLVGLVQAKQVSYLYMLDQFKGMRQDCTVQHIRNELAVRVYEAHARAALEYGDVAEYNQCQSQVAVLYQEGVPGCRSEFLAYRIMYQAVHAKHGEILQLLNTLKRVSEEDSRDPDVAFALSVRGTLGAEGYPRFFRLYGQAPKLGRALMDLAIPKLRFAALSSLVKAFRPALSVRFVASLLGFVAADKGALPASRAPTPEAPSQLGLPSATPSPAAAALGEVTSLGGRNGAVTLAGDHHHQQQQQQQEEGAHGAGLAAASEEPQPGGTRRREVSPAVRPPQSPQLVVKAGAGVEADTGGSTEPLPGCADVVFVGKYAPKSDVEEGLQDCVAWLLDCAAVLTGEAPAEMAIDCKASTGQLKVPEDKTAVAHGDANLAIDDFLSKTFDAAI